MHFVPPHKSLSFHVPDFGFAGARFCCLGLARERGLAPKPAGCTLLSFPCHGREVTRGNTTGFQLKYPGVTRVQVQCRSEGAGLLGMTTITTWLPRSRACGRTQFHCWTCCLSASATHLWFRVEWLSGCPFSHSLWCSLYSNCSS